MPQLLDTNPGASWSNPGIDFYTPTFSGSEIITINGGAHLIRRASLGNTSSVLSFRMRLRGDSIVNSGIAGSTPIPSVYFEYDSGFTPPSSIFYYIESRLHGASLPVYAAVNFGLWTNAVASFETFASSAILYSQERTYRADVFFKKDAQQAAMIYTRGSQRYTSGFVSIGSLADWGAYEIHFTARNGQSTSASGGGRIDNIRIQYNWTDAQVDASYNAAIGGGTIGAGGLITGGPSGEDGLPGQPGGIPSDVLPPSESKILPASTGILSHARILREYRAEAESEYFHLYMGALSS